MRRVKLASMTHPTTEHTLKTARHTTGYLACGPEAGPLLIFVHGWPELSLSWRHQLPAFAALGFRCIAPDMRGYGRSSTYPRHEDYTQEAIVGDMLELLAFLGRERAVWIGHDWGAPVVWNIASHHPERCIGVANLCVPYIAAGFELDNLVPLVDRSIYPEAEHPVLTAGGAHALRPTDVDDPITGNAIRRDLGGIDGLSRE